ncbi:uncharacterized protein LOC119330937 [Triticum dicoccoides]|uniref:uncharacterized protein LOC119330937 n=1 Tax=Triticum dicoccoides TaxID=85692 RepID=UPI00189147EA|nr:uncharacterized protein LOC119330937 [Triticum dicoccoides]
MVEPKQPRILGSSPGHEVSRRSKHSNGGEPPAQNETQRVNPGSGRSRPAGLETQSSSEMTAEADSWSAHVAETTQGRSGSATRHVRGDFKCGAAAGEVTRRRWWLLSRLASEAQAEASLARLLRRAARGRGGGESNGRARLRGDVRFRVVAGSIGSHPCPSPNCGLLSFAMYILVGNNGSS